MRTESDNRLGKCFYDAWKKGATIRAMVEKTDLTTGDVVDRICIALFDEELKKGQYCKQCITEIL